MKTVLSIQSHVAMGYVGNRAATFALQRLGCDVLVVNTVQFSNHTGYGHWRGEIFPPEHIAELIAGLGERDALGRCNAVLSGYLGDAALGSVILDAVKRVKSANVKAIYCCDPVIGDNERGVFVRPGIPDFLKNDAIPVADIITPNQFELEFLTGLTIATMDDALTATAMLRARGPKTVLVTSLLRQETPDDMIEMLVDGQDGAWVVATPRLPIDPPPNGAGDAVAAFFLAHYLRTLDVSKALERAAAAIYAIFLATRRYRSRELQMVAAQEEFVQPTHIFPAERVERGHRV